MDDSIDFFELYETAREEMIAGGFEHEELDNEYQATLYLYDLALRLFGENDAKPGVLTATIIDDKWNVFPRLSLMFIDGNIDPDTLPTLMWSQFHEGDQVVVIFPAKNDPTGLVIEIRRMK